MVYILDPDIEKYIETYHTAQSAKLKELEARTWKEAHDPKMISGEYQGRVLSMLSKMIRPNRILEIGTYTGFSALCLAEGLQESGKLFTIEPNTELMPFHKAYLDSPQIEVIYQNAADAIPTLKEDWDLIYIDGDKKNYPVYVEMLIPLVKSGTFFLIDNTLWKGKVTMPQDEDKRTPFIKSLNEKVAMSDSLESLILPIRDGLSLLRKK